MYFLLESGLILLTVFAIFFIRLNNKNPPPIANIYQRPNGFYWLKCTFMFIILSLQKLKKKKCDVSNLDKPQPLSTDPKAIDAVYFNGASKNGDFLVVGTARRQNKLIDGFFYLLVKDSDFGLLESPKLPGTSLYQTEEMEKYEAEGISLSVEVPMKKWKMTYEGTMKRHENRSEVVDVQLEAEWTSDLPYFNFDSDMDALCMAKAMAYERFTKEYFESLQMNHQTHYEQHGDIKGIAKINGKEYKLDINAVRDHSFGLKREWRNFHRYALHFFTAENGDRFHVGQICLPISFSRLTLGYVYSAKDRKHYPVKWCDLELYKNGEDGSPPLDYSFSFAAGRKVYRVSVKVLHSPHFYISKDWESKVIERLCSFDIDGIKGWGAAEWQYRNIREKNVDDYFEMQ